MLRLRARVCCAVALALLNASALHAQATGGTSGTAPANPPATQPAPAPSPLNFSGVLFGSYNSQRPTTPAQLQGQVDNAFVIDRAYLTFRMPAGDRVGIRITTDVFQTGNDGYVVRAKYAYLQYDAPKKRNGAQLMGRLGILQNVVIDHFENFWPRYLSQSAIERAGYFSSADAGIAGQLTLPNKLGELYATIVNGPGYGARERDRFKDFAARLSLTPLASSATLPPLLQNLTFTAWGYKGATASRFVDVAAGQIAPIGDALDRSRMGLFAGVRDPRLTLGLEYATRHDESEIGLNTAASPRDVNGATGHLMSGIGIVRPFAFINTSGTAPFGIVTRYDYVKPTASQSGVFVGQPPASSNAYHVLIAGMFFDLSQKAQLALDYQESLASNNGVSLAPPAQTKTYFAHFVVNF